MKDVLDLLSLLGDFHLKLDQRDVHSWCFYPSQGVSSNYFFQCLVSILTPSVSTFTFVWKLRIFKKVKFFVWAILHGRVNALDQIFARGSLVIRSFCCIPCKRAAKDMYHLLWGRAFPVVFLVISLRCLNIVLLDFRITERRLRISCSSLLFGLW